MRTVVLDTSVMLPALLSPRGYRRRFWILLAFGALAARRDLARVEAEALRAEASTSSGYLASASLEALAEQADASYTRLKEALPHGAPDDWRLACSRPLLAEYERKLGEAGPRLDPSLRPGEVELLRLQVEAICSEITEDFDPEQIPAYTEDRKDDPVVHTALLADASWLIADDKKHIATMPDGITEYRLPGSERRVSALTFKGFSEQLAEVELGQIDPSLLELAFKALPPHA